jgi:hypothetical protein
MLGLQVQQRANDLDVVAEVGPRKWTDTHSE